MTKYSSSGKNSFGTSRQAGLETALGVATGSAILVAGGMFGLTWAILRLAILFNRVRWFGGLYLLFLGVDTLLEFREPMGFLADSNGESASHRARENPLMVGVLTCLSNPKSALFYLELFTAVITPEFNRIVGWLMGLLIILISLSWYSSLTVMVSFPAVQNKHLRHLRPLNAILGGTLLALGIELVTNPNLG